MNLGNSPGTLKFRVPGAMVTVLAVSFLFTTACRQQCHNRQISLLGFQLFITLVRPAFRSGCHCAAAAILHSLGVVTPILAQLTPPNSQHNCDRVCPISFMIPELIVHVKEMNVHSICLFLTRLLRALVLFSCCFVTKMTPSHSRRISPLP